MPGAPLFRAVATAITMAVGLRMVGIEPCRHHDAAVVADATHPGHGHRVPDDTRSPCDCAGDCVTAGVVAIPQPGWVATPPSPQGAGEPIRMVSVATSAPDRRLPFSRPPPGIRWS